MDTQDSFPRRVWQIVAAIPEGYVTTYGEVAKLAGSPRAARQVACMQEWQAVPTLFCSRRFRMILIRLWMRFISVQKDRKSVV